MHAVNSRRIVVETYKSEEHKKNKKHKMVNSRSSRNYPPQLTTWK